MNIQSSLQHRLRFAVLGGLLPMLPLSGVALAQSEEPAQDLHTDEEPHSDEELVRRVEFLELSLEALSQGLGQDSVGTHRFMVTGFGTSGLTNMRGMDSSFGAGFNPIILYEYGDNFLMETELDLTLGNGEDGGETEVELGYASASYIVNDSLVVGGGKFLTPFGIFSERIHPSWINKLPTAPLTAGHNGIVPSSSVGVFARGALRTGATKWNYSLYLSNGPRLNTGEGEEEEAGLLHFDNYQDSNNSKALGLRIGCLPMPELEFGVSLLNAEVTPRGSDVDNATATLLGVDLSYNPDMAPSSGRIEIRGEWVESNVDDVTYDPSGSDFGPLDFNNRRNGGYAQVAYRLPGRVQQLSPWECVVRFDMLQQPEASPQAGDEERLTFGVNRWLTSSSVVKFAYMSGHRSGGAVDPEAFFVQLAVGF